MYIVEPSWRGLPGWDDGREPTMMREIDFVNLRGGRVGCTIPPRVDILLDYRHPGPRRVWMAGSELRGLAHFR